MNKVEEYIEQQTIHSIDANGRIEGWLTPNDARKAVEIAREEVVDVLREKLPNLIFDVAKYGYMPYNCPDEETDCETDCVRTAEEFIEDFKKAMKGE